MISMENSIGILGGGQLALLLSMAATKLGFRTHVFSESSDEPAIQVASRHTIGSFKDSKAIKSFSQSVNVVTYEFENIPMPAIKQVSEGVIVYPDGQALSISQDRLNEKTFFESIGLKTTPFVPVSTYNEYKNAIANIGYPAILKTRRFGYDGKGQLLINESIKRNDVIDHLKKGPCILETLIDFRKEISVIISRGTSGEVVSFDPGENVHRNGILRTTAVPAQIESSLKVSSIIIAGRIVNALNYVGVMGVEFFISKSNELLLNEIAPRVHNSGHWTLDGCAVDQFEQHIRAITGSKLGDGSRYADVKMVNLIGNELNEVHNITSASAYIYGKKEIRPDRKMGHINYVTPLNV